MADEKTPTRESIEKDLTEQNARRPFQEYPKMLHHPDGRQSIVNSKDEEESAGTDWQLTPQDALDLKAARDKIAAGAQAQAIADALAAKAKEEGKGKVAAK